MAEDKFEIAELEEKSERLTLSRKVQP